jgi:Mn-dependent DtxR family transcriptional regulator
MTNEEKAYFLNQCYKWRLEEENIALRRLSLTESGEASTRELAKKHEKMESLYRFQDEHINALVALGLERLQEKIAHRMLQELPELLNYCPKCGKLTRTPRARQCKHCFHTWFDQPERELPLTN